MIVNKYSVLMLFMAGLGLALAGVLAATACWAVWRIRAGRGAEEKSAAERSVYLATLVAVVCLTILVITWPLLYTMLQSFVPEVPGAMCIYGVTKVMPVTTALTEAAAPLAIFLLAAWLLLEHVHRQSGQPLPRLGRMLALVPVAGSVAFTYGTVLYYVLNMTSLTTVSCCCGRAASGGPQLQAPAYYLPWLLPTPARAIVLNALFFAGVPLLAVWLLVQSRRRTPARKGLVRAESAALLVAAIALGLASLLEFSEVLAPLLMRLPFHHCLYCLLLSGKAPDSLLVVANLTLGVFAAGWVAVLGAALPLGPLVPAASLLHRRLCLVGAAALAAAVLMVVIHLAVYHG
jgi:hypothetical protein